MSFLARLEHLLSPGLGSCYRCGRPWKTSASKYIGQSATGVHRYIQLPRLRWWGLIGVELHDTEYGNGTGCFPLCEGCWLALTPEAREPYYTRLIDDWLRMSTSYEHTMKIYEDAPRILAAVRAGG